MDKITAMLDNETVKNGAFLFAFLLLIGAFKFGVEGLME